MLCHLLKRFLCRLFPSKHLKGKSTFKGVQLGPCVSEDMFLNQGNQRSSVGACVSDVTFFSRRRLVWKKNPKPPKSYFSSDVQSQLGAQSAKQERIKTNVKRPHDPIYARHPQCGTGPSLKKMLKNLHTTSASSFPQTCQGTLVESQTGPKIPL